VDVLRVILESLLAETKSMPLPTKEESVRGNNDDDGDDDSFNFAEELA
jgi:hypothetical protein